MECVQHYFTQSEQINTGIMLAVGQRQGIWRSAGLMLQHMPEEGGTKGVLSQESNLDEDDWRRAMILMGSCTEAELLDPDLTSHIILTRLFHEEGVRVFEPTPVIHSCRCSSDRVENVVMMMSDEDREDMVVDGQIILTCEFCSKNYELDPATINRKAKNVQESDSPHS